MPLHNALPFFIVKSDMKKLLLLLTLAATTLFAQTDSEIITTAIDGYAARVNNRIITYGDIRENVLPFIQQITQNYKGPDLDEYIKKAYLDGREALIEEALFQEEARTLGLALPEQAIDNEVDHLIHVRFNNDRAELSRALAERRMTYDEWRKELADQLTMRVYYSQEVLRRASVSTDAVRAEYESIKENHVIPFRAKYRFILINKGNTAEAQEVKRAQAESTLQKLKDGADFHELAQEVSEGDTSLSPWRSPADIREEMRPALHNLPTGQISDLIETDSVYYIIKVESRQEKGYIPFEDLQEKIEEELTTQERQRLHERLVERLTARHYVKRY
jgi:peptidyl-prolyl cis-trans isomerase SurA